MAEAKSRQNERTPLLPTYTPLSNRKRSFWLTLIFAAACIGGLTAVATIPTNALSGLAKALAASQLGGSVAGWLLASQFMVPIFAFIITALVLTTFARFGDKIKPKTQRVLLWTGFVLVLGSAAFVGTLLYGAGALDLSRLGLHVVDPFAMTGGIYNIAIFLLPAVICAGVLLMGIYSVDQGLKAGAVSPPPGGNDGSSVQPHGQMHNLAGEHKVSAPRTSPGPELTTTSPTNPLSKPAAKTAPVATPPIPTPTDGGYGSIGGAKQQPKGRSTTGNTVPVTNPATATPPAAVTPATTSNVSSATTPITPVTPTTLPTQQPSPDINLSGGAGDNNSLPSFSPVSPASSPNSQPLPLTISPLPSAVASSSYAAIGGSAVGQPSATGNVSPAVTNPIAPAAPTTPSASPPPLPSSSLGGGMTGSTGSPLSSSSSDSPSEPGATPRNT